MGFRINCLVLFVLLIACQESFDEPVVALDKYQIEEGFDLSVVASEPFLEAPVAISFDNRGRIWTAEMRGYMRDIEGNSETEPTGVISILEDLDLDGIIDHSTVFLDSLVMPRALTHVYGGLLYVEPPNLWFIEIENDIPGSKTLVDSLYSVGGNPEHQPNGLLLNVDNWIYSANSNSRYQRKNGKWLKEPTTVRGQWGITKDDFGRLYYNNNSTLLMGDFVLPNTLIRNKYFRPDNGLNQVLTENQKVFPINPIPVNRGYIPGVLNKDSLLVDATSACGPLVYSGGQFSKEYNQNAFVCVPEANMIKRLELKFFDDSIAAIPSWANREFLTSVDDSFRPVNLNVGPDGSMYIVDMHRGVIQHNAYLSPYLKKHILEQRLDTILGMGRILKVKIKDQLEVPIPNFQNTSTSKLVQLLKSKNQWIRDRAQHTIVYKGLKESAQELEKLLFGNANPITQIHALYTLAGLELLNFDMLSQTVKKSDPNVCAHAMMLSTSLMEGVDTQNITTLIESLIARKELTLDLYLSMMLGSLSQNDQFTFFSHISEISSRYSQKPIVQDAIISGLGDLEDEFLEYQDIKLEETNTYLRDNLVKAIRNKQEDKVNSIFSPVMLYGDARTQGMGLYKSICSACHGTDGNGLTGLAPPLMNSEYIKGPVERLGLIILHGMHGPIHVNKKLYDLPTAMPGLINNQKVSDQDIADIISYVTSSFSPLPREITEEKVKELRQIKPENAAGFTEEEVSQF